jgi:tetratricopeptide (TPR) repeat protein
MRVLLILSLLLCRCALGWAQPADKTTERARAHVKAAVAYYDEARYDEAAHEMEAAFALRPLPDLQYNLAQCYERLGRTQDAIAAYQRYFEGSPTAADRALVLTRIENLRQRADAGAAAPPPPSERVVFKTLIVYRQAPPPPGRGVRFAAYGAGIIGLGALAGGIAFAVLASQSAKAVAGGGNPAAPPAFEGPPRDAQQNGHTDVIGSGVAFGVAALCAGGALGLYLLGRKIDREAPRLAMAPAASATAGGLLVAGRF